MRHDIFSNSNIGGSEGVGSFNEDTVNVKENSIKNRRVLDPWSFPDKRGLHTRPFIQASVTWIIPNVKGIKMIHVKYNYVFVLVHRAAAQLYGISKIDK
jgi:hypothetical protein